MKQAPWTDQENIAGLALYFVMLDSATAGLAYNKAALIRAARGRCRGDEVAPAPPAPLGTLKDRSRGSIEAKLMNYTAAHRDIDHKATTMAGFGYVPLANYQTAVKAAMYKALQRRDMAAAFNAGTRAAL